MSGTALKTLIVDGAISSSSTMTGSIICNGSIDISGRLNVGGNIIGNSFLSTDPINIFDNTCVVTQISNEFILKSNANVSIASGNSLVFKNDNTIQSVAFNENTLINDCDTHTFIYNSVNPTTPKYMIASTFEMNQLPNIGIFNVNSGNLYGQPVTLTAGQVVVGAGFYINAGTPTGGFSLFSSGTPATRLAYTSTNTISFSAGMNYSDFASSYIVPTTDIYYLCISINTTGSGNLVTTPSTVRINYFLDTVTASTFTKAAQRTAIGTTIPSNLNGRTMVNINNAAYGVLYTTQQYL